VPRQLAADRQAAQEEGGVSDGQGELA